MVLKLKMYLLLSILHQDFTQHNIEQLHQEIMKQLYKKFTLKLNQLRLLVEKKLDPPKFGQVQVSIKPKNGSFVSDFDKTQIKNKLEELLCCWYKCRNC